MSDNMRAHKVAVANNVIALMTGHRNVWLIDRPNGLYLVRQYDTAQAKANLCKRVVLSRVGECLGLDSYAYGGGHTYSKMIAQLVRWIRGEPKHGLRMWRYWTGEKVRGGPPSIISLLEDAGYETLTECVLCGKPPNQGADWWSDHKKRLVGPCCLYGQCSKETTS